MKLIIYIFSLCIILSLSLWSGDSHAFSFTSDFNKGFYWGSLPIAMKKFVVDEADQDLLEAIVSSSESEWESIIGRNIWNMGNGVNVGIPGNGNFIRWSNNFAAETGFDPNTTLAVTVRKSIGTYIVRTEIILNGHLNYLRGNWGNALKKTLLHELGHTVGLGHSDNEAIMGSSISTITGIKSDDEQGMRALLDETVNRQVTGYISPEAQDDEGALACGSIGLFGGSSSGGLPSLILGFVLSFLLLTRKPQRNFIPV